VEELTSMSRGRRERERATTPLLADLDGINTDEGLLLHDGPPQWKKRFETDITTAKRQRLTSIDLLRGIIIVRPCPLPTPPQTQPGAAAAGSDRVLGQLVMAWDHCKDFLSDYNGHDNSGRHAGRKAALHRPTVSPRSPAA
jgi:hypothetical protein